MGRRLEAATRAKAAIGWRAWCRRILWGAVGPRVAAQGLYRSQGKSYSFCLAEGVMDAEETEPRKGG